MEFLIYSGYTAAVLLAVAAVAVCVLAYIGRK